MRKNLLFVFVALFFTGALAQTKPSMDLIPVPAKIKTNSGQFTINSNTRIVLSSNTPEMQNAVAVLNGLLRSAAGFRLEITETPATSNAIVCKLNASVSNKEGYRLSVQKELITLEAQTPQGIFYGMQTLRQLLPFQIERSYLSNVLWRIPCVEIEDAPRFAYRGLMLDVARHFHSKEFVMKFIDMLAYHKMNRFHWHLTDDQGWRIEIKKYPNLTETGAYRNRTLEGRYTVPEKRKWNNTRYGGYYTQEDIKEVLAYAQKRFVTVVPEIEMPGHAVAALTAYPQLSCTGGPFEVEGLWGVFNDIYCPKEETFQFLENVLSEVADLFPSQYIHIGGDEAPKLRWKNCAHCQALIKKEGLKDEHELQSYFIKRIEKFVKSKGKRIIGWDEILEGGLAPNATVMSWRGESGGIDAAKQNHDVIMTPNTYVYLDYFQANPKTEPLSIGGYLPLWKVYSYNPMPASLNQDEAKHILGIQGNIWTEYITTTSHVEYMAFPRGAAIAETGWSPNEKKNYADFKERMIRQFKRYDGVGWNYCKAILTEEE
ncbi:MAG: beta-N-acetylhexosaminidase [Dysgonamonadaceae bacterium]|jgi:hexosaminidase|nr:beta-N-acetylhexosaminidase [Dysgonamonadaceae bacterium]